MNGEEKEILKLALAVISGRLSTDDISRDGYSMLGYDVYKFGYFGVPSAHEIKAQCEQIVYSRIEEALDKQ